MSDKPMARLIRENERLREIADKAVRLRTIGRQCDTINQTMEDYFSQNPEATRCGTPALMLEAAFATAMEDFDKAVLKAVEDGVHFSDVTPAAKPTPEGKQRCPPTDIPSNP